MYKVPIVKNNTPDAISSKVKLRKIPPTLFHRCILISFSAVWSVAFSFQVVFGWRVVL
eukprot:TRINITY_DN12990_c0_g1_i1.p1 TRINITY_DN12990_c0_g1~~TRINITY_DN12990_c0_g1_i1.p1  ORF type:complete len:58 (-),score=3.11 TRINITY_DN12990_c0_g1_i1:32-205(-)